MDKLTKDILHDISTTYEMRTVKKSPSTKYVTFKATRKPESSKHEQKNLFDISDEEKTNFMRKIKRGHGKYTSAFPFKYFKCVRIGYFSSTKCSFKESRDGDSDEETNY